MKRENLSFWDAVAELIGERNILTIPTEKRKPVQKKEPTFLWDQDKWQDEAQRFCASSERRIMGNSQDALQARNYLSGRAISMATAQMWRLGQARINFKNRETGQYEHANAITIPWFGPCGTIKAIQYRFVSHASRRFHSKYGGEKTIYGAHLLAPSANKILIIVEGELNTHSIWQEAQRLDLPFDVISIGGEGISEDRLFSLVKLVERYRGSVAWLDRAEIAKKVGCYLERAMLLKSLEGRDANSLAQSGKLAGIVEAIYQRFEQARVPIATTSTSMTQADPQSRLYDLLDEAGWLIEGLSGETYAKAGELYLELESAVVDDQVETAYSIYAQIKTLATGQAWNNLALAASNEPGNALYGHACPPHL